MKKFSCDGSVCGSACCVRGWKISVSGDTYRRYEERERITENFRRGDDDRIIENFRRGDDDRIIENFRRGDDDGSYEIAFREGGRCPFLRDDFLCDLQRRHGESFLPDACAEYPRLTWEFLSLAERSLDLTCPVAARLALLTGEPMRFETVRLSMKRDGYAILEDRVEHMTLLVDGARKRVKSHFFSLQSACIALLQDRLRPLDQRLMLVGYFLARAEELIIGEKEEATEALCLSYAAGDIPQDAKDAISSHSFDEEGYLRFMISLMNLRSDDPEMMEKERRYVKNAYRTLGISGGEASMAALLARRKEMRPLYEEAAGRCATILENYFVNSFFMGLYPFRVRKSTISHNYRVFLTSCKAFEFLMMGLIVGSEVLTGDDDIIEMASWFFYREHHLNHIKVIHDFVSAVEEITDIPSVLIYTKKA